MEGLDSYGQLWHTGSDAWNEDHLDCRQKFIYMFLNMYNVNHHHSITFASWDYIAKLFDNIVM